MAISKRVRYEVLRRDNYTCRYCRSAENPLTIDHLVPVSLGGSDDPSNLVAACKDCNAGKSSSNPDAATVAQVGEDAVRWARALEEAARLRAERRDDTRREFDPLLDYWNTMTGGYRAGKSKYRLPAHYEQELGNYLKGGLTGADLLEAAIVAFDCSYADSVYRYMVGVLKRMLAEAQEDARRLVGNGLI